jgi:hypothetical protein
LKPCPAVTIGRPVPANDAAVGSRSPGFGILQASYQPPYFPPGAAAPTAKEIPNGDRLPTWSEVDDERLPDLAPTERGFAVDRLRLGQPATPDPLRVGQLVPPDPLRAGQPALLDPLAVKQITPPATLDPLTVKQAGPPAPRWNQDATQAAEDPHWRWPVMRPYGDNYPAGNPYPYPGPTAADLPNQMGNPYNHFYVTAEYLLWWTKQDKAPPLLTTSTDGTGFLDQANTTVLVGGGLGGDARSGFRGNFGYWLNDCGTEAVEFGGFFLGSRTTTYTANSNQFPVLARPFFNVNAGTEFAELTAFPNISTGSVRIVVPSDLWGLDMNLRCNICCGCDYHVDGLVGFRYLDLKEGIEITESVTGLPGAPPPFTNAQTTVFDSFLTHNQFYGAQVGLDGQWRRGPWVFDVIGKLALGATTQHLNINGSETIVAPDGTVSNFTGGLLALPGNIGQFNKTKFSVVPEIGLTVGYQLTDNVRLYAGYNFLYWTNVARPGQQIDRNLDVTKIPNFAAPGVQPTGQNNPMVPFKQSDYWAQGLVFGLEFRY